MNENDYGFLYGAAETEEEEPLENTASSDRLEEFKLQAAEKEKQRKDKRLSICPKRKRRLT